MEIARAVPQTAQLDAENPYAGLQPFTEADQVYFYGRSREQDEIFRLVRRGVLTVCFGASGTGKTSLLNAGLFPRLRKNKYFPLPIRLDFGAAAGGFVAQVKALVAQQKKARQIDAPDARADETLWEYFHRAPFWDERNHLVTPVLVFDQFEEIFTLGEGDERVQPFLQELADLIENRLPNAVRKQLEETGEVLSFAYHKPRMKVILSLREDFLPQLEDLRAVIPSVAGNRFRLTPMNGLQAREAVLRPGGVLVTEAVAEEIVYFTAGAVREKGAEDDSEVRLEALRIEPALLSLVCRKLNESRRDQGQATITRDLLSGGRQRIYTNFYDESTADLPPPVRAFVEDRLLTSFGFRTSVALEEATQQPGVTEQAIGKLVDRRVLRIVDRLDLPHVELIHDVLTGVIRESRDLRRIEWRKRRIRRQGFIAGLFALIVILGLGSWAFYQRGQTIQADKQRTQAEKAISFLLELSDELQGFGNPNLLGRMAGQFEAYVQGLPPAYRNNDFSALIENKTRFLEGLAALGRGGKGDTTMALQWFEAYRDTAQVRFDQEPDNTVWLREVAIAYQTIGSVYEAHAADAALENYNKSWRAFQNVYYGEETDEAVLDLVDSYLQAGDQYGEVGNLDMRSALHSRAVRILEPHLERQPNDKRLNDAFQRITSRINDWVQTDSTQSAAANSARATVDSLRTGLGLTIGLHRRIYDARGGRSLPGVLVRDEGDPATNDPTVNEMYDNIGVYYDFLQKVFDRQSLDGQGKAIDVTIHYRVGYASAFWNGQYAIFGDGDTNLPEGERRFGDFARVPTIVWGILTREMIPYIAPLSYRNQSGALSTSFRDVFAVLVEQWHKHQTVEEADWLMGVGIYATREAISSLKAPGTAYNNLVLGKDPQPSHMDNYVDTPNNNGGVHINSGIPNHAFYLIAKEIGGHAWEEAGQIWYQTLFRLTPTSDFDDFAQKTFGVAGERYGDGSPEQDAVRNGWEAVGISVRQR